MADGLMTGLSLRRTSDLSSLRSRQDLPKDNGTTEKNPEAFSDLVSQKAMTTNRNKESKAGAVSKVETERGPRRTEPEENTPSVKERSFDKTDKPKTKKASSLKDQAMLEFMDSMESEFSIPPQRIVEAMARLPQDQKLQTPEETASQVIEALNLPPEQQVQALQMYTGFIQKLSLLPPEVAETPSFNRTGDIQKSDLLLASQRRERLNDSLDRLSQKFFLREPGDSPAVNRLLNGELPLEKGSETLGAQENRESARGAERVNLVTGLNRQALESVPPVEVPSLKESLPQDPRNGQGSSGTEQVGTTSELLKKLNALGVAAAGLSKAAEVGAQSQPQVPSGQSGEASQVLSSFQATVPGSLALGSSGGKDGFGSESSEDPDQQGLESRSESIGTLGREVSGDSLKPDKLGFREALGAQVANQRTEHSVQPNIERIMNQANMIVRKGGGEATVKMYPEGLGEVHLKVIVKDGRVNLEMATESKEVKKLIESQLSDLKAGLGQHKLSVESVKVESTLQSSSDHSHNQKNPDLNQDTGRDQARQMFQQFREDSLNRRESFFEMPGIKGYGRSSKGPDPLAATPDDVRAQSVRRADGRGERMNLVA